MSQDAVDRRRGVRSGGPVAELLLLFGALLLAPGAVAQAPAEPPTEGTLFETVSELQTDKIDLEPPAEGVLSIPYTRVDVAVDDGIAITRLLQVFHNHGDESVGYGFSLPLLPDTTISQFTLWDQGRRLVGSIEDRRRAEETYREVTGDEAPTMRRDPGLVRQTGDRFDLRIFPIVPGESKQMELFTHRRLPMEGGELVLELPLASLARSHDPRHPDLISRRIEVSLFVQDELPIVRLSSRPSVLTEVLREPHRILLRLDLEGDDLGAAEPPDLEIRFSVDLGESETVATTHTYDADGGDSFFSTRILSAAGTGWRSDGPDETGPEVPAAEPEPSFYIGVWRSRQTPVAHHLAPLRLELTAALTAMLLPSRGRLHASWRAPRVEEAAETWLVGGITTGEPIPLTEDLEGLEPFLDQLGSELAVAAPSLPALLRHVRHAVRRDDCRRVLLFLDTELFATDWDRLSRLLTSFPRVSFTLVTVDPWPRAANLGLPNVEHFALRGGWQSRRPSPQRRLLETGEWHELGWFGLEFETLAELWQELPWLQEALPAVGWRGDVEILAPQIFLGGRRGEARQEPPEVIWLSGRYRGDGPVGLEVELPGEVDGSRELPIRRGSPQWTRRAVETRFEAGGREAYVASLWARQRAEGLSSELRVLRDVGADAADGDLARRREAVRQEVVELSRRYSFISSETAFIALPEDLRREHGIEKQAVDAQQLYNLAGMKAGGLPEPEEWMLLALGAALVLGLWLRRA